MDLSVFPFSGKSFVPITGQNQTKGLNTAMGTLQTKDIRNVCLLGHGGDGKTSLTEAMLYVSKGTDRLGKTPEGNTVCDYDPEEIRRGFSLSTSIAPVMWKNTKINLIDTPGYLDFVGEVMQAVRISGSAIIVVDAKSGIEVGTELAWGYVEEAKIPRAFFINKCDDPESNFSKTFESLRDTFGVSICPLIIPAGPNRNTYLNLFDMKAYTFDENGVGKETEIPEDLATLAGRYHNLFLESIAETSDELMEKYFAGEPITQEEAEKALHDGLVSGQIAPVYCGSALKLRSVTTLMDSIVNSFPSHVAKKTEKIIDGAGIANTPIDEEGKTAIFIWKTVSDPFVGKMSYFKVMNGKLDNTMSLKNGRSGVVEKMSHIFTIRGKKQTEVTELCCGDIGVINKLSSTGTNDTLSIDGDIRYRKIVYPDPVLSMAVTPKAKGDEDKIASGINKLLEEDFTLGFENNVETKQLVLKGLGDIHLDVVTSKLKSRYGVSVDLSTPQIAYRETIKKKVQCEGKHKKQSGGHGQYGHVRVEFSPGVEEGLTFTESVVGGSVPKNFFPAVEKGLQEAMQKGVLAGFPMVNLAANLYDGSYHDVDSSEMAFKLAANLAYKDGIPKANPVILEPVGSLKVKIPDSMMGDVIGDINKRRGRVMGMNAIDGKKGYQAVDAEVPCAEMLDYAIALRAISGGKGSFTFNFERYEEAPGPVAQKIIEEAKAKAASEE